MVCNGIALGEGLAALDRELLRANGFTHVLNMAELHDGNGDGNGGEGRSLSALGSNGVVSGPDYSAVAAPVAATRRSFMRASRLKTLSHTTSPMTLSAAAPSSTRL